MDIYSEWHTKNIIMWFDGTIHPWRGHEDCDGGWHYEGQVFAFKCNCKTPTK